jgi:hypothetical protein
MLRAAAEGSKSGQARKKNRAEPTYISAQVSFRHDAGRFDHHFFAFVVVLNERGKLPGGTGDAGVAHAINVARFEFRLTDDGGHILLDTIEERGWRSGRGK